jgi:hypothetical protein
VLLWRKDRAAIRKAAATRVLALLCFRFLSGLPALFGTRGAKVACETNCFSVGAQIRAVFADDHFRRFHSDSINLRSINAAHPVQSLALCFLSAFLDFLCLVGIL